MPLRKHLLRRIPFALNPKRSTQRPSPKTSFSSLLAFGVSRISGVAGEVVAGLGGRGGRGRGASTKTTFIYHRRSLRGFYARNGRGLHLQGYGRRSYTLKHQITRSGPYRNEATNEREKTLFHDSYKAFSCSIRPFICSPVILCANLLTALSTATRHHTE